MAKRPGYPCPCCGHIVFSEPPGSYDICKICFWEDDPVQLRWADFEGGANKPSLIQAQRNYATTGVSEARFKQFVRTPRRRDAKDPAWRPFDTSRDYIPPPGTPWPDERVRYYWLDGPNERR